MNMLTESDRKKIEASVENMLEAAEIQNQKLLEVSKAQMIKDCIGKVMDGTLTVAQVLAENEECERNTRINRMRGRHLESELEYLARQEGIYES